MSKNSASGQGDPPVKICLFYAQFNCYIIFLQIFIYLDSKGPIN
jgi:hypothetical protein